MLKLTIEFVIAVALFVLGIFIFPQLHFFHIDIYGKALILVVFAISYGIFASLIEALISELRWRTFLSDISGSDDDPGY